MSSRLPAVRSDRERGPTATGSAVIRRSVGRNDRARQSPLTVPGDGCHAARIPLTDERTCGVDFDDSPDEAAYRARVRDLLEQHADELLHMAPGQEGIDARTHEDEMRRTQRVLADAGLVGVTWPREYGGQGSTLVQQSIVSQELARARVPVLINHIGIGMCGPTVITHGSQDQRDRYLARLLRADDVWCQLFSEPASGSDLAALRTTAVRDGDDWLVNGQKVWTTLAHVADYGILLTRTDPDRPKHAGLTMFVVDMHAPGVTVRPLRQLGGQADFNEVFFDDVRIPDSERLGEPGEGWRVALTTLMNERVAIGGARGRNRPPGGEVGAPPRGSPPTRGSGCSATRASTPPRPTATRPGSARRRTCRGWRSPAAPTRCCAT